MMEVEHGSSMVLASRRRDSEGEREEVGQDFAVAVDADADADRASAAAFTRNAAQGTAVVAGRRALDWRLPVRLPLPMPMLLLPSRTFVSGRTGSLLPLFFLLLSQCLATRSHISQPDVE